MENISNKLSFKESIAALPKNREDMKDFLDSVCEGYQIVFRDHIKGYSRIGEIDCPIRNALKQRHSDN